MVGVSLESSAKKQKTNEFEKKSNLKVTEKDCSWIAKSAMSKQTGYGVGIKPKIKRPKLLGSKSLCQLVPRSLFFKKNEDVQKNASEDNHETLMTTRSFPSDGSHLRPVIHSSANSILTFKSTAEFSHFSCRINSDSLIGLPRQSSSNSFCRNSTLTQSNLSPIVNEELDQNFDMSWTDLTEINVGSHKSEQKISSQPGEEDMTDDNGPNFAKKMKDDAKKSKKKVTSAMYKPFKTTNLVLKDVKNSIGLRLKARHESQAFAKLTEDMATPPSKLYSPFDIYTDTSCIKATLASPEKTVKRKINLNAGKQVVGLKAKVKEQNKQSNSDQTTPKANGALLERKRHLERGNKFTFDSPTGRLRDTVKDVEQFQQCIEDISDAIQSKRRYH